MKVCLSCGGRFTGAGWDCPHCGASPDFSFGYLTFAPELASASDSFDADLFAPLARYEAGNFWFENRNRLLIWALERYFPAARSFLEIGCGTGFVLAGIRQRLPRLSLSGSDIFSQGLSFAQARIPDASLYQMDARRIPFEEEFDVIGAFDVLEHITEDETVLVEMYRATRPGGGVMLTVPQHPFLWSALDEHAMHKRRYTRRDLVEKVRRAGFRIVRLTSFVSLLLPAMVLSRLAKQRSDEPFDPFAEFKISPRANAALSRLLGFERFLITSGLTLPAGGSLLVVAMRDIR